jgi:23S rRNA (uridine2552-2'-O)-methyltransferase
VAGRVVGPEGRVVGVDLLEMLPVPGVRFVQGDFGDDAVLAEVEKLLDGRAVDLVLSDMAPNMSGVASVDQARSIGLAELALDFTVNHLKPQGNFLVKVFQGSGFETLVADIRRRFVQVMIRKPEASRSRSNEVYLVAKGLKAQR